MSRRSIAIVLFSAIFLVSPISGQSPRKFRVWVFSDAHVGTDLRGGRESLAIALRQSESPGGFPWDIALDLGDVSGAQGTPKDEEGRELVRQFGALKHHRREEIYDLSGNHDRSGLDEPQAWWWRKWVDPTGEHTEFSGIDASKRPFPTNGTWERYSFRAGNLLFLMMSDINEPTQKIGRGTLGGNPAGVVSGETFRWWKRMVEENPTSIIITAHHYVLKNTTVASGDWEGMTRTKEGWKSRYHGYFPQGSPQGASYLYWVDSQRDSGAFEKVLDSLPGRVGLWLGAHTHTSPEDTYGGRSHVERRWGTAFINVAALTKYHTSPETAFPRSWLLTFTDGSEEATAQCYLHGDEFAPQGWYPKLDRTIRLAKPFRMPAGNPK
ncbi:MAG: metallophosphoesterase [Bryobacterales bacterium]|nr:metallophosphoesterase [Bryobacterales bacterium]